MCQVESDRHNLTRLFLFPPLAIQHPDPDKARHRTLDFMNNQHPAYHPITQVVEAECKCFALNPIMRSFREIDSDLEKEQVYRLVHEDCLSKLLINQVSQLLLRIVSSDYTRGCEVCYPVKVSMLDWLRQGSCAYGSIVGVLSWYHQVSLVCASPFIWCKLVVSRLVWPI